MFLQEVACGAGKISRNNQFTGFRREPRIESIATGQKCGEEAEGNENAMKQVVFV